MSTVGLTWYNNIYLQFLKLDSILILYKNKHGSGGCGGHDDMQCNAFLQWLQPANVVPFFQYIFL